MTNARVLVLGWLAIAQPCADAPACVCAAQVQPTQTFFPRSTGAFPSSLVQPQSQLVGLSVSITVAVSRASGEPLDTGTVTVFFDREGAASPASTTHALSAGRVQYYQPCTSAGTYTLSASFLGACRPVLCLLGAQHAQLLMLHGLAGDAMYGPSETPLPITITCTVRLCTTLLHASQLRPLPLCSADGRPCLQDTQPCGDVACTAAAPNCYTSDFYECCACTQSPSCSDDYQQCYSSSDVSACLRARCPCRSNAGLPYHDCEIGCCS
jgi:hypothetical protein